MAPVAGTTGWDPAVLADGTAKVWEMGRDEGRVAGTGPAAHGRAGAPMQVSPTRRRRPPRRLRRVLCGRTQTLPALVAANPLRASPAWARGPSLAQLRTIRSQRCWMMRASHSPMSCRSRRQCCRSSWCAATALCGTGVRRHSRAVTFLGAAFARQVYPPLQRTAAGWPWPQRGLGSRRQRLGQCRHHLRLIRFREVVVERQGQ